ncbi:MAG TPA: peptidoglycan DD-metalloendopeptidase family protein [Longimicrobiales bacterium]|nr:peptidoglycan DD-metalloendopeptidase family protein [Longimicrobiales bacterium]
MTRAAAIALLCCTCAAAVPAAAQQNVQAELRASQLKLDSIKNERARLQREMDGLRTRVRDMSRELLNIEKQRQVSHSALLEMEFQTQLLLENFQTTSHAHEETRERLRTRTHDLNDRLRAIYKRGPMHATQVILTSRSFGDLLNRYKYLHLVALYDRMVVRDVARLERELGAQEDELRASLRRLDLVRDEKAMEVAELERVERQRQTTLRQLGQQETRTASRIMELEREQQRLTNALADLERKRREEEARRAGPAQPASLTTRDLGNLQWPVDGSVVYRFGPEQKPNGVVLKNNGIGIAAPAGSAVRAVESGVVELAGPFPGYGPTVIISHGGGYYTLYLYLKTIAVAEGQQIAAGATLGTVGGEQTPEGAHIEFQVRVPMQGGVEPVDPLTWLRARAGGGSP